MMARSLLERSGAHSIMDKSRVKKGEKIEEYLQLSEEGLPEKQSIIERTMIKPKKEGILTRAEHGIVHWMLENPEEHRYLHALAEGLRREMRITGETPSERMKSIGIGIEHGVGKVGGGLLSEAKRLREQYSRPVTMPSAMTPSAIVEGAEVEIPTERIPTGIPSGDEILICQKIKLRDVV